jgi:hypothetical protein
MTLTRDNVWMGNWIYWTLTLITTNNYDSPVVLHTPKIIVNYSTELSKPTDSINRLGS